jgi:hypothetical protein
VLIGEDWSRVNSALAWSWSSPRIWRRLVDLQLGGESAEVELAGESCSVIRPIFYWIEERLMERGEEELLELLECVLAVGGDFHRHSFSEALAANAPRAVTWLVEHGATAISVEKWAG